MNKLIFYLCIVFCILFNECSKNSPNESQIDDGSHNLGDDVIAIPVVYLNSFESPQDTIGWIGISYSMFVDDPLPAVGEKSLRIGGGCMQPAAYLKFDKTLSGHNYRLDCWGKTGINGGSIVLTTAEVDSLPRQEVSIEILDSVWTHYSSDIFHCPEDKTLQLDIYVGGIIFSEIYVDYLGIEQVD